MIDGCRPKLKLERTSLDNLLDLSTAVTLAYV